MFKGLCHGVVKSIKVGFLYVLGKIKVYRWPMFVIYSPKGYDVRAAGIRKALSMARTGDIFVRRYRNYLDGYFIPGRFTHSGICIGDGLIVHSMSDGVQKTDIIDFLRCDGFAILRPKQSDGRDMAELTGKAAGIALKYVGNEYDYDFAVEEGASGGEPVYCHELVRKCYPGLDIPMLKGSLWHGILRSGPKYLAQSFFDSPDLEVVYDSDYSEPR